MSTRIIGATDSILRDLQSAIIALFKCDLDRALAIMPLFLSLFVNAAHHDVAPFSSSTLVRDKRIYCVLAN